MARLLVPKLKVPKITWRRVLAAGGLSVGGLMGLCAGVFGPCWTAWIGEGVLLATCPVGRVRPVVGVDAYGLGREDVGTVEVAVAGHYVDTWDQFGETPVRRFSAALTLVAPDGTKTELEPEEGWDSGFASRQVARVKIPDGPDGDYTLRVAVDSPAGDATLDLPLALYQPALAHVLTDAPLYKPGQEVHFRAVLLGAADLAPLEGRPGVWKVWDPAGELLLEERAMTGPFGVVAGSFPLDGASESGDWAVAFESGPAVDRVTVAVRPFQLPRFTVDVKNDRPYWRIRESPFVEGVVRYTSGAPVANADVRVVAGATGEWPPPPAWLEPRTVRTDAGGAFRLDLDSVPADLRGQATLNLSFTATDETGSRAAGAASVLLSEDALAADVVTELAGGMVPSANNRVYLRLTTPDGRVLPGATVRVRREWDPGDPGLEAVADADGVARFQLDPGEPITVVLPAMPARPARRASVTAVALLSADDLLTGEAIDIAGQAALDRWTDAVRGCAHRVSGAAQPVAVAVLLGADGRVRQSHVTTGDAEDEDGALARCVAARLPGLTGPPGRDRLWGVHWRVSDPETPVLIATITPSIGEPGGLEDAVDDRLADARGCVAGIGEDGALPHAFWWRLQQGSGAVALVAVAEPEPVGEVPAAAAACVERVLAGLRLPSNAHASASGMLRLVARVTAEVLEAAPAPRTFPGFAFRVTATRGAGKLAAEELGSTVLRVPVGAVPDLRLRFSEVIVDAGAQVDLTAVRGPAFTGSFPEELMLRQGDRTVLEFPFDPDKRTGALTLPAGVDGFLHVEWLGARAVLYVRPARQLALSLATDRAAYRPGDVALLTVTARDADGPVAAGVTLSGVDSTLATLAPLPQADAFARVTVRATSDAPAFGVLDARALQTGQIAGENAAQAAVLRVSGLPALPPGADRVNVSRAGAFSPDAELSNAFYDLYRQARAEVRKWEAAAPEAEVLTAARMVALWEAALSAHPAEDAFGRPLHLSALPSDLRALTDPRFMASDGARLPEDVENWSVYVATEAP